MMLTRYNLTPDMVDEFDPDFLESLMAYMEAQANVDARKATAK